MDLKKRLTIGLGPSSHQGPEQEGPFLRVTSGPSFTGRYDVDTSAMLFWRADSRPPNEVFQTGLSSRFVRNHNRREIVWRCGVDDIVHASAVCLARDLRGAAFFPFPEDHGDVEDEVYLYAMRAPKAASTYDIQRAADMAETSNWHFSRLPQHDWRNPARFAYDPTWDDMDDACCVWQFAEYAVHEVPRLDILAAWKFKRRFLVEALDDERVVAGIRFQLQGPTHVGPGRASHPVAYGEAVRLATPYLFEVYPRSPDLYVSYFGIVRAPQAPYDTRQDAKDNVVQIQAIVVPNDGAWNERGNY